MEVTRESLRVEKLSVSLKQNFLDFPVLARCDVKSWFPGASEAELDAALNLLVESGFITVSKGPRGGVRYMRTSKSL